MLNDNYKYEIEEAFGYMRLEDIISYLQSLGGKIVVAKEYLEDGYYDNTRDYIELTDTCGNIIKYPNSTMFIVVEKQ